MVGMVFTVKHIYSIYGSYGMPKGKYRGITVKAEVYHQLEELRGRLGLRSVADVVEHLLEKALKPRRGGEKPREQHSS